MKSLNQHILEKLKIKKQVYTVSPTSKKELVDAIKAAIEGKASPMTAVSRLRINAAVSNQMQSRFDTIP